MKKFSILVLGLALAMSLAACGSMRSVEPTTPSTAAPTPSTNTVPQTRPTMTDPTIETNIPDPTVDSNSTDATNGILDSTGGMG